MITKRKIVLGEIWDKSDQSFRWDVLDRAGDSITWCEGEWDQLPSFVRESIFPLIKSDYRKRVSVEKSRQKQWWTKVNDSQFAALLFLDVCGSGMLIWHSRHGCYAEPIGEGFCVPHSVVGTLLDKKFIKCVSTPGHYHDKIKITSRGKRVLSRELNMGREESLSNAEQPVYVNKIIRFVGLIRPPAISMRPCGHRRAGGKHRG